MKNQPSNSSPYVASFFRENSIKCNTDVLFCATDRPLPKTFKSVQEIEDFIAEHAPRCEEDKPEMIIARVDQWMVASATALPREKTLRQREKYFGKVKFSTLQELLLRAKDNDGVL